MTAYFLFALCVFAFLLVGVVSMVGAKDNGAELMAGRRDRLEKRKQATGTVTALDSRETGTPAPETRAA